MFIIIIIIFILLCSFISIYDKSHRCKLVLKTLLGDTYECIVLYCIVLYYIVLLTKQNIILKQSCPCRKSWYIYFMKLERKQNHSRKKINIDHNNNNNNNNNKNIHNENEI